MFIENELSHILSKKSIVCNFIDGNIQLTIWGYFL